MVAAGACLIMEAAVMQQDNTTAQMLDIEAIRQDFPILHKPMNGCPLVYLDSAASAQKPRQVLDAMTGFYEEHYANIHRGLYALSQQATNDYEAARATVATYLGAADTREIVFTRNATEAINLVAATWGRTNLREGDEIVLTALEHHANIVPWYMLAQETGAVLRVAPVQPDGNVRVEDVAALMGPKTRLMAVTHMSNALGTIVPVEKLVELAHAHDALALIDGSQAAVHLPVNMAELGCDFYVMTGHKLYGPTGIGVLYGRLDLLNGMPPYQGGGDMIDRVSFDKITYADAPQRFEAGTPAIAEAIGLARALEYIMAAGRANILRHEEELRDYAHECLSSIAGLTIYGTSAQKGAIVSFTMDCAHPSDIATVLDQSGIAIRAGHHCAQPLMDVLDVSATARASFAMYNRREDVEALAGALEKAHRMFS